MNTIQIIEIHPFRSGYPFGLEKQTPNTFVQVIREIHSVQELSQYKANLETFKLIDNSLVIGLDSFIIDDNKVQIYYQYQPVSLLSYLQEKSKPSQQQEQQSLINSSIISHITHSIDSVIELLSCNKILAILSIDSIAVFNQQLKFFIDPDFQLLNGKEVQDEVMNKREVEDRNQIMEEYYCTEKKKLHIQLEQRLEILFRQTQKHKHKQKKPNFVIQGATLVFVNDQITRKSSLDILNTNTNNNKNKTKNEKKNQTLNNMENKNKKFDIANILDEKKMLKNNQKNINYNLSNNSDSNSITQQSPPKQPFTLPSHILRKQLKKSFKQQQIQQKQQQDYKQKKQSPSQNNKKQIINYFQNNDDFNKDASFYPEQFIKQDSISQLEGFEEQLQKQLQDLKKSSNEIDENQQNQTNQNKKQIERAHMKNKNYNQENQQNHQENNKFISTKTQNARISIVSGFTPFIEEKIKLKIQQKHFYQQQATNLDRNIHFNNSSHKSHDNSTEFIKNIDKKQNSYGQNNINLHQIQQIHQDFIQENKKTNQKINNQQKKSNQNLNKLNKLIDETQKLNKKEQIKKILQNIKNSTNKKNDDEIIKRESILNQKQVNFIKFIQNPIQNNQHKPNILLKNEQVFTKSNNIQTRMNMKQNQQMLPVNNIINLPINLNNNPILTKTLNCNSFPKGSTQHLNPNPNINLLNVTYNINVNSKGILNEQVSSLVPDKEYLQKIQKAKQKAEQIMKMVKERKANQPN